MRSFGFAQDDGGFALNGSGPALNENLPTVILRERSEPKDLLQLTALPNSLNQPHPTSAQSAQK